MSLYVKLSGKKKNIKLIKEIIKKVKLFLNTSLIELISLTKLLTLKNSLFDKKIFGYLACQFPCYKFS